jgi:hypothetical protein
MEQGEETQPARHCLELNATAQSGVKNVPGPQAHERTGMRADGTES